MANPAYRKLPGFGLGISGKSRLWLGSDHILQVTSSLVAERYRRFYLRDIESVIVQGTGARRIWNWIHGIVGGLSGLLGGGFAGLGFWVEDEAGRVMLLIVAGSFGVVCAACLLIVLINSLLGQGCAGFIRTRGGIERLPALRRLPQAQRFLAEISPRIESAQTPQENIPG